MVAENKQIDYTFATVGDLAVETVADPKTGRPVVEHMLVHDEPIKPTDRWWQSLYSRFGFNSAIFRFFPHEQVFQRVSAVEPRDRLRLCIERDTESGESRLLACSNPAKPVVRHDALLEMLGRYEGQKIRYCDGVVQSTHIPRAGVNTFQIGGDEFANRFVISSPIDGYGQPSIFLSLLRQICSNGAVGFAPAFRSTLALGRGEDDVLFSLVRALDGFSSDEGYAALRQRFEAAAVSWASVYEAQSLYRKLVRMLTRKQVGWDGAVTAGDPGATGLPAEQSDLSLSTEIVEAGSPIIAAFHRMTGNASELYGLANMDALSVKRQRTLPVKAKVLDLINFASELATHHLDEQGARAAQGWLGTLISGEYDLENSVGEFGDFQDFFVSRRLNGEIALDLQQVAV
jgi:hypothetical protein